MALKYDYSEELRHIATAYGLNYVKVYPTGHAASDETIVAAKTDEAMDVFDKAIAYQVEKQMIAKNLEFIEPLALSVLNKGENPAYHDRQMYEIRSRAPILFNQISNLVGYYKKHKGAKK